MYHFMLCTIPWRRFWSCRGIRGLGFAKVPVNFCWLLGLWGGYIVQVRVVLTMVDWCIFLADVSISRVVIVILIWEIGHNPFGWCDAFIYRLLTFRTSEFQSNMIVVSTIFMFFKGVSSVLHFNFPRSFVEMCFNAFPKFFLWRKYWKINLTVCYQISFPWKSWIVHLCTVKVIHF